MRHFWICSALVVGCSSNEKATSPLDSFDRSALLTSVGSGVIAPAFVEFENRSRTLASAVESLAASPEDPAALASAQEAWRDAMGAWQRCELMQVGPAGTGVNKGGQGLRDEVYSWPTTNSCRIDQELVSQGYAAATFPEGALVNVYGLAALEYLLFQRSTENTCPPQVTINQGAWAALTASELAQRRGAYARVLAAHVAQNAQSLANAWKPGAFLDAFVSGTTPYASSAEAVDQLFAAIFYLELTSKDLKLARPLGLMAGCTSRACPELLESPWSKHAKENLLANLEAFKLVFNGGTESEAVGFDDMLDHVQASELKLQMLERIDHATSVVSGMTSPMNDLLTSDREALVTVHAAVKEVTDLLKNQMVTVLALEVPSEGAGDND